MKKWSQCFALFALFAFGYTLGATNLLQLPQSEAQPAYSKDKASKKNKLSLDDLDLSKETLGKVKAAYDALSSAREALKLDGKYTSATDELNPYLILSGGGNAVEDLESGRGVDPGTFAALYLGNAVEEVQPHLGKNAEGHITYKNKTVRLIPVRKLQEMADRKQLIRDALTSGSVDSDF